MTENRVPVYRKSSLHDLKGNIGSRMRKSNHLNKGSWPKKGKLAEKIAVGWTVLLLHIFDTL